MKKLKKGDHIRVVSPSSSIQSIGGFEANLAAKERLEELGFHVSFSSNYFEHDLFDSASIASRVEDLHEAFLDPSVDAILATIGGFNCNELLPYLDYDLIAQNPKIFCGYSDTTALLNARNFQQPGIHTRQNTPYGAGFRRHWHVDGNYRRALGDTVAFQNAQAKLVLPQLFSALLEFFRPSHHIA